MTKELRPNAAEVQFLDLAYGRFYDLFEEVMDDSFWSKDAWHRYSKIHQGFSIYAELLNYEPIKWVIEHLKTARPPMESEIGSEVFKFVRNIVSHFPYFGSWDDIWFTKTIINWNKEGLSVDKFLEKYQGKEPVKYRFWEPRVKRMTYLSVSFPDRYDEENRIYLKDMISEKEGVKFSLVLMKQILATQIEQEQEGMPNKTN